MSSRYDSTLILENNSSRYSNVFSKRKIKFLTQYTTPMLDHPTAFEITNLQTVSHVWKLGDKFWKLAYEAYDGRSDLWWIIAWFNRTPTEAHLKIGDIVTIPHPLERIYEYYDL